MEQVSTALWLACCEAFESKLQMMGSISLLQAAYCFLLFVLRGTVHSFYTLLAIRFQEKSRASGTSFWINLRYPDHKAFRTILKCDATCCLPQHRDSRRQSKGGAFPSQCPDNGKNVLCEGVPPPTNTTIHLFLLFFGFNFVFFCGLFWLLQVSIIAVIDLSVYSRSAVTTLVGTVGGGVIAVLVR